MILVPLFDPGQLIRIRGSYVLSGKVLVKSATSRVRTSRSSIVGQKVNVIGCRIWRLIWCSGRWLSLRYRAALPPRSRVRTRPRSCAELFLLIESKRTHNGPG